MYPVTSSVTHVGNASDIKFAIYGILFPGHTAEINLRIVENNWRSYNFSKDWSHQRHAAILEPNYFMTVYDASHNILWGSDPWRYFS